MKNPLPLREHAELNQQGKQIRNIHAVSLPRPLYKINEAENTVDFLCIAITVNVYRLLWPFHKLPVTMSKSTAPSQSDPAYLVS